jgi:hypothetical protein
MPFSPLRDVSKNSAASVFRAQGQARPEVSVESDNNEVKNKVSWLKGVTSETTDSRSF